MRSSFRGLCGCRAQTERSAPLRLTSAPQSRRMLTSVSTSVMRGTSLMMSGSSVKSPAARMGSTAFLAVLTSTSPLSRGVWRIRYVATAASPL